MWGVKHFSTISVAVNSFSLQIISLWCISFILRQEYRQCPQPAFLSGFNYKWIQNDKLKCLSWFVVTISSTNQWERDDRNMEAVFYTEIIDVLPISSADISKLSRKDPVISKVIHHTLHGWPKNVSDSLKPYVPWKMQLSIHQDCLLWGTRVIVSRKKTSNSSPITTKRWASRDHEN